MTQTIHSDSKVVIAPEGEGYVTFISGPLGWLEDAQSWIHYINACKRAAFWGSFYQLPIEDQVAQPQVAMVSS